MSQDSPVSTSWQSVAAELRACREKQQETWGDLDHALIGRYLAGEVNRDERARVEASLDQHPELRVLTEVVSEVLGESFPTQEEPAILSFKNHKTNFRSRFQRYQGRFALAAAACLLLGLSFVLNQDDSSSDRRGALPANSAFFASREPLKGTMDSVNLSLPEMERVARADALVEKQEYEKAAQLLFAPPQQQSRIQPTVEVALNSTRINHCVAKLTESVLDSMKKEEAEDKSDAGLHPPSMAKGGTGSDSVMSDKRRHDTNVRSAILSQSVPYLMNGMNQQTDSVLRERSATVLKQLGPRARQAEPELEELVRKGCKEVSPRAREVLSYVRRPFWIGVKDHARVLDEKTRARINERIAELSRKHQIYIVAETVQSLPTEEKKHYATFKSEDRKSAFMRDVAEKRCQETKAEKGVYVLICMDPPSVQVAVGCEVKKIEAQGWSKDVVQAKMQESMKKRDLDKGLEEVVQMIEQAIAK